MTQTYNTTHWLLSEDPDSSWELATYWRGIKQLPYFSQKKVKIQDNQIMEGAFLSLFLFFFFFSEKKRDRESKGRGSGRLRESPEDSPIEHRPWLRAPSQDTNSMT